MICRLVLIILCFLYSLVLRAEGVVSDTIISFVNFYPGNEIYELEGHSVLRITTPAGDYAISYGTYNFNEPNFVYRFVKGETDYWVTAMPWPVLQHSYCRDGRRIVEHRLNLNSSEKERLMDLVSENLRPENRTYRYNYVKDNCATRPLAIVEATLGDSIILGEPSEQFNGDLSFRDIMRTCHTNYPWYQFGIDLALGSGIDYKLNNREKAFAPVVLDSQLTGAYAKGHKLVAETVIINDTPADNGIDGPTSWLLTPIAVAIVILLFTLVITIADRHRKRVTRWFDCALFSVNALAGILLTFLVFVSVHEATSPNILLLWLNPLCLIQVIFIWIKRCRIIVFSYQIVNFAALVILVILWLAGIQTPNVAFIPLVAADAIRSASYIYLTYTDVFQKSK